MGRTPDFGLERIIKQPSLNGAGGWLDPGGWEVSRPDATVSFSKKLLIFFFLNKEWGTQNGPFVSS